MRRRRLEVAVSGPNLADRRPEFAEKMQDRARAVPTLRDLRFEQDAGLSDGRRSTSTASARAVLGVTTAESALADRGARRPAAIGHVPNYWADPKSGIGYQVQVEVPQAQHEFAGGGEELPVARQDGGRSCLRNVADVTDGTRARRIRPLQHAAHGDARRECLPAKTWAASRAVSRHAISDAGEPPPESEGHRARADRPPMAEMFGGCDGSPARRRGDLPAAGGELSIVPAGARGRLQRCRPSSPGS